MINKVAQIYIIITKIPDLKQKKERKENPRGEG